MKKTTLTPTMKKTKGPSLKLMEKEEEKKMKMDSATCKVKFVGWRARHRKDWESWVANMCFVHKSTWENAGIYEAIMSSTYIIERQDDLILELASRWCSQTNTFVFPWGEATLTLEDVSVLGGFSSSGVLALSSLENDPESLYIKEQLELARKEIIMKTKSKAPLQSKWIEKFKDSSNDLEHAAFLSLWLSRYVFPVKFVNSGIINKHVFPVAAWLSRGIKIALGLVVLAMLYRDLSTLSKRLLFTQLVDHSVDNVWQTNLCALFHLVQIWAWERFLILQPVLDCTSFVQNFPRLARWSNVKILNDKDLCSALDSGEEAFLWRPYGSSYGQCIDAVELVGFDSCIEKYQPKRVARQFGLDQDTRSEDAVDCVPPGFAPRIEVIHVIDSDSDDDCDVPMTELLKLPILETGSRTPFPSSIASPDVVVEDVFFVDKTGASERVSAHIKREDYEEDGISRITNKDQLAQLQHSNLVSPDEEVEDVFFVDKPEAFERASVQIKREDCEEDGITNKGELAQLQHSNSGSPDEVEDSFFGDKTEQREDYEEVGITNKDQLAQLKHSNLASPEEEVEDVFFMEKTEASERASVQIKREDYEEDGITNKDQLAQLQHSNLVSPPSDNESNEAMDVVNGSVHETREDEGEEVADANHDEVQGTEGEVELATSCDAQSYTNERSKDSGLDLEARISRLEDIVYASIKELETAM